MFNWLYSAVPGRNGAVSTTSYLADAEEFFFMKKLLISSSFSNPSPLYVRWVLLLWWWEFQFVHSSLLVGLLSCQKYIVESLLTPSAFLIIRSLSLSLCHFLSSIKYYPMWFVWGLLLLDLIHLYSGKNHYLANLFHRCHSGVFVSRSNVLWVFIRGNAALFLFLSLSLLSFFTESHNGSSLGFVMNCSLYWGFCWSIGGRCDGSFGGWNCAFWFLSL